MPAILADAPLSLSGSLIRSMYGEFDVLPTCAVLCGRWAIGTKRGSALRRPNGKHPSAKYGQVGLLSNYLVGSEGAAGSHYRDDFMGCRVFLSCQIGKNDMLSRFCSIVDVAQRRVLGARGTIASVCL
jgi:hypothetical protein